MTDGILPIIDDFSRAWFDGAKNGELLVQRCTECTRLQFYPRQHCVHCLSADVEWFPASGKGTLHTFSVVHRTPNPEFAGLTPYVFAIVELDEGPRMTTQIIETPFDELECDLPVAVVFRELPGSDVVVPYFAKHAA